MAKSGSVVRGALLALGAATLFGLGTPLLQRAGAGVGPFAAAACLYAGAAFAGALLRRPLDREARLQRADLPRLVWMALFGAVLGPCALAWGLQRSSATASSLMLTLEAVFTALLARVIYGEALGRRGVVALGLLTAGGMVLVAAGGADARAAPAGLLALLVATAAWGADNTLSRALAERDPGQVVMAKALLGASVSAGLAAATGDALPRAAAAIALLMVGALGYGLSLRLYLLAQRSFGAARTASVFGFAPFIGALGAVALGDRAVGPGVGAAAVLMLAGVWLHLSESHGHEHRHELLEHEHAHRHDDGHHDHVHEPLPVAAHSHWHRHEPRVHAHAHGPDVHHAHRH